MPDSRCSVGNDQCSNQDVLLPPQLDDLDHFWTAVAEAKKGVGGRDVIEGRADGFPGSKEGIPFLLNNGRSRSVSGDRVCADDEATVVPDVFFAEAVRPHSVELGREHDQDVETRFAFDLWKVPEGSQSLAGIVMVI